MRADLSVFSFGDVHSKRRRASLGVAARSTILLGTIDSHGTGGAFLAQAKAKSKMNKNMMTVFVFIVSTIRLSLGLDGTPGRALRHKKQRTAVLKDRPFGA